MNKKELDLFIELAPKLNEYRGEWQRDDKRYCSYWKNECPSIVCEVKPGESEKCRFEIWLPFAIDPDDPDRIARGEKPRGLWGMLVSLAKKMYIETYPEGEISTVLHVWHKLSDGKCKVIEYKGISPTYALLLALREQFKEGLK